MTSEKHRIALIQAAFALAELRACTNDARKVIRPPLDEAIRNSPTLGILVDGARTLLPAWKEKRCTQEQILALCMVEDQREATPGPYSSVRKGETRIYFAVPSYYTIGDTFATYKEAEDAARSRIKPLECGGFSRQWVDVRIADKEGDRMLHRVEVFQEET